MAGGAGARRLRPLAYEDRIYGLETEYIVSFVPDRPDGSAPFALIADLVERSIPAVAKACRAGHAKGGYFLENGAYVHFELCLRDRGDTPILEVATPECRSAQDAVRYFRAQDLFLRALADRVQTSLRRRGFRGRLLFGKTNLDRRGRGLGLHENYLVDDPLTLPARVGVAAAIAGLLAAYAPLAAPAGAVALALGSIPLTAEVLAAAARGARRAARRLWSVDRPLPFVLGLPALVLCGAAWPVLRLAASAVGLAAVGIAAALLGAGAAWRAMPARWRGTGRALLLRSLAAALAGPILLYGAALRRLVFVPFRRDLLPFLATRPIFGGTGRLSLRAGPPPMEISQRAALLRGTAGISPLRGRRTFFDLKQLLYRPWEGFRRRRRLTIASGDTNMSEPALGAKIGATALVIEMIERGERFPSLRLRDPVGAMRAVSRGGPFARVPGLPGLTALEVQRAYLARARAFFGDAPPASPAHRALDLWEDLLEALADRPDRAADAIDWCAKKQLLDGVVLPACGWRAFGAWGAVLEAFEREAPPGWEDLGLEALLARLDARARARIERRIREQGLDPRHYARFRELYLRARKIELGYHEVSPEGGYHDRLEEAALVRRLTLREEVEHAVRMPPRGTRAWARGALVKESRSPADLEVRWDRVRAEHGSVVIRLADPFCEAIPAGRRAAAHRPGRGR